MEKRRYRRFAKRFNARYGDNGLEHSGFTKNVSLGGAFVAGGKLFPVGAHIHVQLLTGGDKSVYFEAVVCRQRLVPPALRQIEHAGMGVSFRRPAEVMGEILPMGGESNFEVAVPDPAALRTLWAQQLDKGGIFVKTDRQLARDTAVVVSLHLDFTGDALDFGARVVQVLTGQGLALAFEDPGAVKVALQRYVS